jgi:2-dehydro-3-deoxy-L-rhamnonate dehydrogenase (NAD+)
MYLYIELKKKKNNNNKKKDTKKKKKVSKMARFTDQVALVTGGAQGIGYGIAELLGSEGAHVVLLDMSEPRLVEAVAKLTNAGIKATSHVINVSKVEDWTRVVETVLAQSGRIDILVQAAGVTGKTGIKTEEVPVEDFEFVMNVNAKGIFLGCRAVLPAMKARNYGRILNIASVAGKEGNAGMVSYSASKGAVIAMTKATGKEYAETGITVNALAPAVVRTAMVDAMPEEQVCL